MIPPTPEDLAVLSGARGVTHDLLETRQDPIGPLVYLPNRAGEVAVEVVGVSPMEALRQE